jgi:hypothetical protein
VLHAPYSLVYQLALLSSELRDIFDGAPPIDEAADPSGESDKRKPVEGDCPICYSELESGGDDLDKIVWCRAACGQNMHQACFEMWARTKASGRVTCPMCRSQWEGDETMLSQIDRSRGTMMEGYVNVADQLGISTVRGKFFLLLLSTLEAMVICMLTVVALQIRVRTRVGSLTIRGVVGGFGMKVMIRSKIMGYGWEYARDAYPKGFDCTRPRFSKAQRFCTTWTTKMLRKG